MKLELIELTWHSEVHNENGEVVYISNGTIEQERMAREMVARGRTGSVVEIREHPPEVIDVEPEILASMERRLRG